MLSFLLSIHFILTLLIICLIMLQKQDSDGALGSSGGGSAAGGMFSVRGQANVLTRATAILMSLFVINCLCMAKIAKNKVPEGSIIDRAAADVASTNTNNVNSTAAQKTQPVTQKISESKTNVAPTTTQQHKNANGNNVKK